MRIRIKLVITLLIIVFIPLLVLSIVASSKYADIICQSHIYALQNSNSDKSAYINELLQNINSNEKSFTADAAVRKFVDDVLHDAPIQDEDYAYVEQEINYMVKKSSVITDMFIVLNGGKVIASYTKENIGSIIDNVTELQTFAGENNGFSYIYPPPSGGECYFYAVRRIYSPTNQNVGLVCQVISLEEITAQLKQKGYSNYSATIVIDSAGKYIANSFSTPKALEDVAEYRDISKYLGNVIPFYGNTLVKDTITAEYDGCTVCGNVVQASNWSVVTIYENDLARSAIRSEFSSITVLVIVLSVFSFVGILIVSIQYTKPIKRMVKVINRKNQGDNSVKLKLNSNDEFGEISTEFNTMLDSIYESELRYKTVVSMTDNIVFEINLKTFKVYVSDNFNQKFSFRSSDESINESFLYKLKIHKDDAKKYADDLDRILSPSGKTWNGEYRMKNIYGDFSWIRIKGEKYGGRNSESTKIIGMMTDIDREKKSAINLMQKANFDALTQLYNRASFLKALDDEMLQSVSRHSLDALMFIDLDDFKHFNDEFGHKCGDEVLKFIADTIKEITFDKGFGGRLGGDEFVMCLTNLKLIGDAGKAAYEMISILNEGFISESCGEKFNIHCSIGISFFRENGNDSNELLEAADAAMYRIKKSGKSNFAYAGLENSDGVVNVTTDRDATFDSTFLR